MEHKNYSRTTLLEPARTLCTAFSTSAPIPTLLSCFTTNPVPLVHEHGLPVLAPFLGRTFTGNDGLNQYLNLLADTLSFRDMSFDPEEEWIVDSVAMAVSLRGRAVFTWKGTGQSWEETFCYRLGIAEDVDGGGGYGRNKLKVQEYRVWADSGAAYLARVGKLDELQEQEGMKKDEKDVGQRKEETTKTLDTRFGRCEEVVGVGVNVYGSCV